MPMRRQRQCVQLNRGSEVAFEANAAINRLIVHGEI